MQDFVSNHVGFQHVSRETILVQHQTAVATKLLTNGPDQIVLIADGTYFSIKSRPKASSHGAHIVSTNADIL